MCHFSGHLSALCHFIFLQDIFEDKKWQIDAASRKVIDYWINLPFLAVFTAFAINKIYKQYTEYKMNQAILRNESIKLVHVLSSKIARRTTGAKGC